MRDTFNEFQVRRALPCRIVDVYSVGRVWEKYGGRKPTGDRPTSAPGRSWIMKRINPVLLTLLAISLSIFSQSAQAGQLIYSQNSDNQSTFGPSQLWAATSVNSEVADEFNVVANIDRVVAGGFVWGTANFQGVYVRFYEFGADNKPGALQHEYFLGAGDPNVAFDQTGAINVNLSPAFVASGRHFLS